MKRALVYAGPVLLLGAVLASGFTVLHVLFGGGP